MRTVLSIILLAAFAVCATAQAQNTSVMHEASTGDITNSDFSTVDGIIKGDGSGNMTAAVEGTDYAKPGIYARLFLSPPDTTTRWADVVIKCSVDGWASVVVWAVTADPTKSVYPDQTWAQYPLVKFTDSGGADGRVWQEQDTSHAIADSAYNLSANGRTGGLVVALQEDMSAIRDNPDAQWVVAWLTAAEAEKDSMGNWIWRPVEPRWVSEVE